MVNMKKSLVKLSTKRPAFFIELKNAGQVYKAKADTISKALDSLKPKFLKTKGIFTIKQGRLRAEIVMLPFAIKRLLRGHKVLKSIFEKKVMMRLQ